MEVCTVECMKLQSLKLGMLDADLEARFPSQGVNTFGSCLLVLLDENETNS